MTMRSPRPYAVLATVSWTPIIRGASSCREDAGSGAHAAETWIGDSRSAAAAGEAAIADRTIAPNSAKRIVSLSRAL
jgi:hypothetical protein